MKDIYKLVGVAGATVTGVYAATMTAVLRQQEINANKEIALKKLEQESKLAERQLNLNEARLDLDKERFEFEKMKSLNSTIDSTSENLINSNTDEFIINSTLESSNLVVENMSLTFICFTSVTIVLTVSLTFNYLIKMYGDKLLDKLPKTFYPIYNFYKKYLLFSNLFNLSIILFCQTVGLLLCLFLYFN